MMNSLLENTDESKRQLLNEIDFIKQYFKGKGHNPTDEDIQISAIHSFYKKVLMAREVELHSPSNRGK